MLKSLPSMLHHASRQPTFWSAIVAIGVHGVLWVVLPILPSSSQTPESKNQRPVGLVELTPQEESRLPSSVTASVLPAPEPQPNGSDLYPLAPLPDASTSLLAPPPLPSFSVPSYSLPNYSLPSFPPIVPPPSISIVPRERSTIPTPSPSPSVRPSPSPSGVQPNNPGTIASSELDRLQARATSPSPNPSSSPSPSAENPSPAPSASPNAEGQRRTVTENLIAEQRQLRELYSYNDRGISESDGRGALLGWFQSQLDGSLQGLQATDIQDIKTIPVEATFPREACPLRLERVPEIWLGVVVAPDDKLVGDPQLLRSSGYGILNLKAVEVTKDYEFKNDGDRNQPFWVRVQFQREANSCPSVTAPTPSPNSAG